MKLFHILAILISLAAAFSYLNYRYLKLPTAIGLMLIALLASLALSLPQGPVRDTLVTVTCVVVAFSILVQGLTIGPLVRRTQANGEGAVKE